MQADVAAHMLRVLLGRALERGEARDFEAAAALFRTLLDPERAAVLEQLGLATGAQGGLAPIYEAPPGVLTINTKHATLPKLPDAYRAVEAFLLRRALELSEGRNNAAARLLGMSPTWLCRIRRQYGL